MGKKKKAEDTWGKQKVCSMCNGGGTISIRDPQNPSEWKTLKCGECRGTGWV